MMLEAHEKVGREWKPISCVNGTLGHYSNNFTLQMFIFFVIRVQQLVAFGLRHLTAKFGIFQGKQCD